MKTLLLIIMFVLAGPAAAERWFADPAKSKLEFVGIQQNAKFRGSFSDYWVDMNFDQEKLADAYLKTTIQMKSVDTQNEERDEYLIAQEWFYISMFPTAQFVATDITTEDNLVYTAKGQLTLRGVTGDVDFTFTFEENAATDSAKLVGYARVERLDFGVGQGEWMDTTWVGNPVQVEVDLFMRRTLE